jgi:hypothetical protein
VLLTSKRHKPTLIKEMSHISNAKCNLDFRKFRVQRNHKGNVPPVASIITENLN